MGLPAAILGSAGLGLIGSFISGGNQRSANRESTNAQIDAAKYGYDLQSEAAANELAFYENSLAQQRADLQAAASAGRGYINKGFAGAEEDYYRAKDTLSAGYGAAEERLIPFADPWAFNQARGFLENPSDINQLPGVEWQKEEGIKALQNAFSRTTGGGLSGNKMRAAEEFGQNYASTQLDTALNRLIPFINLQMQTTGSLADLDVGEGTGLSNIDMNLGTLDYNKGQSLANLEMQAAGGMVSSSAGMAPMIGNTYGSMGTIGSNYADAVGSAYSDQAIANANIGTNQMSYLTGLLGNTLTGLAYYNDKNTTPAATFTGSSTGLVGNPGINWGGR